jgi:soluble lytic murein transglycosylase-like protein
MTFHTQERRGSKRATHAAAPARRLSLNSVRRQAWLGLSAILLILCGLTGFAATLGTAMVLGRPLNVVYRVVDSNRPAYASGPTGPKAAASPLSAVFTPEVQYWAPLITTWAEAYQIDPNLIATVIQIESCGDSQVSSPSGAQGLFQVMPFHFDAGEDMLDVQTNARRGLDYLLGSLDLADGHVGLALAGYNGGHGVIARGWGGWSAETRRYYYWGARIYSEAVSGMASSPTLQEWLNAGGANLCARANVTEQQLETNKQARSVSPSTN